MEFSIIFFYSFNLKWRLPLIALDSSMPTTVMRGDRRVIMVVILYWKNFGVKVFVASMKVRCRSEIFIVHVFIHKAHLPLAFVEDKSPWLKIVKPLPEGLAQSETLKCLRAKWLRLYNKILEATHQLAMKTYSYWFVCLLDLLFTILVPFSGVSLPLFS